MRNHVWRHCCLFLFLTIAVPLWFTLPSHADSDLEHDLQGWGMVTLRQGLNHNCKLQLYLEAQPRVGNIDSSGDRAEDFSLLLLRPALGYQINKHVSVWQGYAWAPTFQPRNLQEHRIFQQLLIENNVKRLALVNRTRLEERWIENTEQTSVRLRHMARAAYALGKSRKWAWVAYDELFINLNTVRQGPRGGFDQNRAFVGVNRKLTQHINAEAGYLNQMVNRQSPAADRMNHALMFTLNVVR